jgi:hypothetical protein
MARTTNKDLETFVELLNKGTDNLYDFSIGHAYGGVRLERKAGSVDVSPRLSRGELYEWMSAFAAGLDHATEVGYIGASQLRRQYEASRH